MDSVKKNNTNIRRNRKYAVGEQRLSLDSLIKNEEKPLKVIFKKVAKFNKKQSELRKYVFQRMDLEEERTLQKYVALKQDKDG